MNVGRKVRWAKVEAAIAREQESKKSRKRLDNRWNAPKREVVHPRLGEEVSVEVRTVRGSRITMSMRGSSFRHLPGAITERCVGCSPSLKRQMDAFYGRIDADLRRWDFERDLALRCPYAVKRDRKDRKYGRTVRAMLKRDAVERGLV